MLTSSIESRKREKERGEKNRRIKQKEID